jgi:homoserine dehydrogenase
MDTPSLRQHKPHWYTRITSDMISKASLEGKRYKLVCSVEKAGEEINARVAPELVDASSPLYGILNSSTGVSFRTDVLPDYSITVAEREGMSGGPIETAYGLFADFARAARAVK